MFLDLAQLTEKHSNILVVKSHQEAIDKLGPPLVESIGRLGEQTPRWISGMSKRPHNVAAYVGLLRARFVIHTDTGPHFGTVNRMRAMGAQDVPVPEWLKDLVNATGRVNQEPPG